MKDEKLFIHPLVGKKVLASYNPERGKIGIVIHADVFRPIFTDKMRFYVQFFNGEVHWFYRENLEVI